MIVSLHNYKYFIYVQEGLYLNIQRKIPVGQ